MVTQLPLHIQLRDDTTFTNFYVGDNSEALHALKTIFSPQFHLIYLWGRKGTGRSHLLQACCYLAETQHKSAIYLSLRDAAQLTPVILEGLENLDLICLDDIEMIAANPQWEEALFHCYNRCMSNNTRLVFAASLSPKSLHFNLKDLQSRLSSGLTFQIHALTDEQKIAALQMRAQLRGLILPPSVAEFLINHYPRNTQQLFQALDKLDRASLIAKRKLTVPFVKEVL